jgi:hypothetical protein
MEKGDKIKMYFHGAGVISEEIHKVIAVDEDTVTIDDGDDGRKFHRKTGKCLTDNNWGGCHRTIDKC